MNTINDFQQLKFRQSVEQAIQSVERILDSNNRRQQQQVVGLAEDVSHQYDNKFDLANCVTNLAILAHYNVLERLGVTKEILNHYKKHHHSKATLRFQAKDSIEFVKEQLVKVSIMDDTTSAYKSTRTSIFDRGARSSIHRVTNDITEYHWKVTVSWELIIFPKGAKSHDPNENIQKGQVILSRESSTILITQTEDLSLVLPEESCHGNDRAPIDISLTWLLKMMDFDNLTTQFKICDTSKKLSTSTSKASSSTIRNRITPRRNKQIEEAVNFFHNFKHWANCCTAYFENHIEGEIIKSNDPAEQSASSQFGNRGRQGATSLDCISVDEIFVPIQPIMKIQQQQQQDLNGGNKGEEEKISQNGHDESESSSKSTAVVWNVITQDDDGSNKENDDDNNNKNENENGDNGKKSLSPLLSNNDMNKILNEQTRTIDLILDTVVKLFPAKHLVRLISVAEATLVLLCKHISELGANYLKGINYIETMLKQQLISAIGKTLHPHDVEQFVRSNNIRLLTIPPKPFVHSIKRDNLHYPDGMLSIENKVNNNNTNNIKVPQQPIETICRKVESSSQQGIKLPISSSTTIELKGDTYLHGWLRHRFHHQQPNNNNNNNNDSQSYQLIARAKQFSCFILVIGTMAGPDRLDPIDAIIIQNKEEVIFPLLLDDIQTKDEFKDSMESLSPEQQRFVNAFRDMQLSSSVLGIGIVQIKPQLEKVLGLPNNSLTREVKLTQDIIGLFVDYQIPSDLISYDGPTTEGVASKEIISNVRANVDSLLDTIEQTKTQPDEHLGEADIAQKPDIEQDNNKININTLDMDAVSVEEITASDIAAGELSGQKMRMSLSSPKNERQGSMEALLEVDEEGDEEDDDRKLSLIRSRSAEESLPQPDNPDMFHLSVGGEQERESATGALNIVFGGDAANMNFDTQRLSSSSTQQNQTSSEYYDKLYYHYTKVESNNKDDGAIVNVVEEKGGSLIDGCNFTMIPRSIASSISKYDIDDSVRFTIVHISNNHWIRKRPKNSLLTRRIADHRLGESEELNADAIQSERAKAFDLLDAMSNGGSLPIACDGSCELHVLVSMTQCFENDVMGSVIQDSINPIEKLEKSTLLLASIIHNKEAKELIRDFDSDTGQQVRRLTTSFPELFLPPDEYKALQLAAAEEQEDVDESDDDEEAEESKEETTSGENDDEVDDEVGEAIEDDDDDDDDD